MELENNIQDPSLNGLQGLKGIRANASGNDFSDRYSEMANKYANIAAQNRYNVANNIERHELAMNPTLINKSDINGLLADFGNSKYDAPFTFQYSDEAIRDNRWREQSALTQIGAGLAKGAVIAGTTFLDGVAMWTYGIGKGIANKFDDDPKSGFWDGIWNNEITKAMQSINELAEDVFKNYYSTAQEEGPWYSAANLKSANFIGDKFLKNIGFMVGAFGSGNVLAAASRLPRLIAGASKLLGGTGRTMYRAAKTTAMLEGSVISAVSEGGIEALNGATEWRKTQIQNLDDKINTEIKRLNEVRSMLSEDEYNRRLEQIQTAKEQTLQRIDEDAIRMGNTDFLLNIPILTATNLFDWGRLYASGFKNATRFASKGITQTGKGEGKTLIEKTINGLENKIKRPTARGIAKGTWRTLQEGREEMDQALAEQYAGLREQQDVDNYFRAALNGEAYERTYDNWKAAVDAWSNTYGNGDRWEEFAIGSISSMFGMPRVRGAKNAAGKFQSPITFEGGILQDVRESREEAKKADDIIKYLKDRLTDEKFVAQFEGMTGHQYWQNVMDKAAEIGDKKTYKDAEVKQFVTDLTMMHKAGLLNNAEAIVDVMGDLSDLKFDNRGNLLQGGENTQENINNFELIKSNDKVKNEDGTYISQRGWFDDKGNQKVSDKQIADDVNNRRKKILKYIDNYKRAIEDIDYESNGVLSDDQITELAWTKMLSFGGRNRAGSIINEQKDNITEFKTNVDARIESLRNKSLKNKGGESSLTAIEQKELEELEEASRQLDEIINTDFEGLEDEKKFNKVYNKIENLNKLVSKYSKFGVDDESKEAYFYSSYIADEGLPNDLFEAKLLLNTSKLYDEKYKEYINNPGKLHDQILEERKQAENENIKRAAKDVENRLKQMPVKTNDDINKFEKAYDEELSKFEEEGVDEEINKYRQQKLKDALADESSEVKDVVRKIEKRKQLTDAFKNSFTNALNSDSYRNLPEDLKGIFQTLFTQYFAESLNNLFTDEEAFKAFDKLLATTEVANNEDYKKVVSEAYENFKTILNVQKASETSNNESTSEPSKDSNQNGPKIKDDSVHSDAIEMANRALNGALKQLEKGNFDDALECVDDAESHLEESKILTDENKKILEDYRKRIKDAQENSQKSGETSTPQASPIVTSSEDETPPADDVVEDSEEQSPQETDNDQPVNDSESAAIDNVDNSDNTDNKSALNVIKNWINTLWDYNSLKDKINRRLKRYKHYIDEKTKRLLSESKSVNFLNDHGTFDFIDSGELATADMRYQLDNDGKKLPIYFYVSKKNGLNKFKNGDSHQDVYMVVEYTNDIKDNHKGNFNLNPIIIDGKQYIPVGVVGHYGDKNSQSKAFYDEVRKNVFQDWRANGSKDEFISNYTTEASSYYSGRIVLSDETADNYNPKQRFLKETPFNNPDNIVLGIAKDNVSGEIYSPKLNGVKYKRLNANNPSGLRAGSVWLMIKGADGIFYPIGVRVARFDSNWKSREGTPVIEKIKDAVRIIVNPNTSDEDKRSARDVLEAYIAFPRKHTANENEKHHVVFGTDKDTGNLIVSILGNNHSANDSSIFDDETRLGNNEVTDELLDKRVDAFLNTMAEFNYRFGVSGRMLKDSEKSKTYVQDLIDSDILSTNILKDQCYGGSFEIEKIVDKDGNDVVKVENPIAAKDSPSTNPNSDNKTTYTTKEFKLNGSDVSVEIRDNKANSDTIEGRAAQLIYDIDSGADTGYVNYNGYLYNKDGEFIIKQEGNNYQVYEANKYPKLVENWNNAREKANSVGDVQQKALDEFSKRENPFLDETDKELKVGSLVTSSILDEDGDPMTKSFIFLGDNKYFDIAANDILNGLPKPDTTQVEGKLQIVKIGSYELIVTKIFTGDDNIDSTLSPEGVKIITANGEVVKNGVIYTDPKNNEEITYYKKDLVEYAKEDALEAIAAKYNGETVTTTTQPQISQEQADYLNDKNDECKDGSGKAADVVNGQNQNLNNNGKVDYDNITKSNDDPF